MKKIKLKIELLKLFYKTWFNVTPKVGEKVKVAVGFSSYLNEGTVSSVHEGYCWIHQYNIKGELKHCFTASFCYCQFHYIL